MKQFLSYLPVLLLGFLLGGAVVYTANNYSITPKETEEQTFSQNDFDSFFNDQFDDDFFSLRDKPFKQMEKLRENMDRLFRNNNQNDFFDKWFGNKFGGNIIDVTEDEDANNVYFKITLKGLNKKSLKIDIKDGMVILSGSYSREEWNDKNGFTGKQSSSFTRSFPVPYGVDEEQASFETKGDQIVVKFPKKIY